MEHNSENTNLIKSENHSLGCKGQGEVLLSTVELLPVPNNSLKDYNPPSSFNAPERDFLKDKKVLAKINKTLKLCRDKIKQNINLDSDFKNKSYLAQTLQEQINSCSNRGYAWIVCKQCNNIADKKPIKLSCMLPYCTDDECIENRIRTAKHNLYNLNINTKKLYHFSIGFKPITKLTNEARQEFDKVAQLYIKTLKKIVPSAHFIFYRDINKSKSNELRLHYHVLSFGFKGFRKPSIPIQEAEKMLSTRLQMPFKVQLIGYKTKNALFNYAAKRLAGVFGHNKDKTRFYYKDFMLLDDYAKVIHRKRRLWCSFSAFPLASSESDLIQCKLSVVKKCPYCAHTHFKIVPKELYVKPPLPKCSDCGAEVHADGFCYELGICKLCSERKNPDYEYNKMQELRQKAFMKFNPFQKKQ